MEPEFGAPAAEPPKADEKKAPAAPPADDAANPFGDDK
jgi:hypothetical protein